MKLNKFAYLYSKPLENHTLKIMNKKPGKSWKYHGILSVRKSGNPVMAYLHWQRQTWARTRFWIQTPMATLCYVESVHIVQTRTWIPTLYMCVGQESKSESESGSVNEPLATPLNTHSLYNHSCCWPVWWISWATLNLKSHHWRRYCWQSWVRKSSTC